MDAAAVPFAAPDSVTLATSRGTVLVVDDEPMVAGAVAQILERAGYVVHRASGPGDAEAQFDALHGAIDLLLTDVVMPDGGGRKLAERLRQRSTTLHVLFMSGYVEHDSVRDTRELDAPLISKPFSGAKLVAAVQRALDGE